MNIYLTEQMVLLKTAPLFPEMLKAQNFDPLVQQKSPNGCGQSKKNRLILTLFRISKNKSPLVVQTSVGMYYE